MPCNSPCLPEPYTDHARLWLCVWLCQNAGLIHCLGLQSVPVQLVLHKWKQLKLLSCRLNCIMVNHTQRQVWHVTDCQLKWNLQSCPVLSDTVCTQLASCTERMSAIASAIRVEWAHTAMASACRPHAVALQCVLSLQ